MFRFIVFYSFYTLVVGAVFHFFLSRSGYDGSNFVAPSSFYFYVLNLAFHAGLVRASAGRPAVFVRYYMGATTIKLFLHLGVIVFFALLKNSELMPFAIVFLLLYLAHTGYEAAAAFRKMRESA
ncbi:MAG: hypothetical protein ACKOQ6_13315 [Bacteroidota bacterium]